MACLRLPPAEKPSWFIPDNRPDLNYWFWIDLPAMAAADRLDPAMSRRSISTPMRRRTRVAGHRAA